MRCGLSQRWEVLCAQRKGCAGRLCRRRLLLRTRRRLGFGLLVSVLVSLGERLGCLRSLVFVQR
eukprot:3219675-Pyramimonas_sp.AAC.1